MPSNTSGGFPYPLPSEPVRDGAIRIQGLAETIDQDPDEMQIYRGVDHTATTGAWGRVGWTGVTYSHGSGLAAVSGSGGGVKVTNAGRYFVQGGCQFPGSNGGGRRMVGVADASLASPPGDGHATVGGVSGLHTHHFGRAISLPAGATVSLFIFQDSGANLVILAASIWLNVFRLRK